jgi:beta-galactosidase
MTTFIPLDRTWNFRRLPAPEAADGGWTAVDLPHSPFVADLNGQEHWFGECEYQRTIERPRGAPDGRCALYLGAAMHSAVVLVDGVECGRHTGGYLPFEVDLTATLQDGRPHGLTLRLDNRDNPDVPPGKPYAELDFCWFGGLYRNAELRCYPPVHITDEIAADQIAGGGVFVRTLAASAQRATVRVKTHVANTGAEPQDFRLAVEILQGTAVVTRAVSPIRSVSAAASASGELDLEIDSPRRWQPSDPALYHARVTLLAPDGRSLDTRTVRFGIRRIEFSRSGGFILNGSRVRLRGTNRHQDHPHAGYAVPRAAQLRDARRIKEAGFDYVRLAHYPQSPGFLDACDELGIVVMNCIPGWQFLGGESFRAVCRQNARELIRRDRNHPCVILWELSLNETAMDEAFMAELHAIGHEEYPGDQMFTCGWIDRYDVYTHSRQHGEIHRWQNGDKALVIAECADWEFYASNHGFDQKTRAGIFDAWSTARQFRGDGERGLRQQAANHLIALNDTLSSPAVLEGQWSMFDYPRGYDPVRAACGVMDIFRLPKFSYHFYRSQRDAAEGGAGWSGGAAVFIASHWTAASELAIPVFSNCAEVELRLNGTVIARQRPARTAQTQYLPHPPFMFQLPRFVPGILEAVGYCDGRPCASHRVATPGEAARLTVGLDGLEISAADMEPDLLCAHAELRDARGTLCIGETVQVSFSLSGDAVLLGPLTVAAEAGIASIAVRVPAGSAGFVLHAFSPGTGLGSCAGWPARHPPGATQSLADGQPTDPR